MDGIYNISIFVTFTFFLAEQQGGNSGNEKNKIRIEIELLI